MGQILSIVSGKGGVGKSTISAVLGASLAQKGKKVLVIDLDAGLRSLDIMLGIAPKMVHDFGDLLTKNCSLRQAIYPCELQKGLFVIPAPADPDFIFDCAQVAGLVSGISSSFDYILLDSPAGLGNGFQTAVKASTKVLVVATADPVCVRDAKKVSESINSLSFPKEDVRLIINRAQKAFFKRGLLDDVDTVIDTAGIRLIAILPELPDIMLQILKGNLTGKTSYFSKATDNLCARLNGDEVKLLNIWS